VAPVDQVEGEFYGYRLRDLRDSLVVMTAIGMFGAVLGMLGRRFSHLVARAPWSPLWLLVLVPGIWLVVSIPLSATWLELRGRELHWTLWRRWLIGSYPVDSVRRIGAGSFSAVRIVTTRGTIHLFGLHMRERTRLAERLRELNPGIIAGEH
jgi:hypothetical protein